MEKKNLNCSSLNHNIWILNSVSQTCRGRHGHDHMVNSVVINTNVVSLNPVHGGVYLIQHYVIMIVSDLRQVVGFLRVLRFPPSIKLTTTI
jgi:hypothetical protein